MALNPRHAPLLMWGLLGLAISLTGCGNTPPAVPLVTEPVHVETTLGRLTPEQANDVTLAALGLVGTPYRYGGNTPAGGFDCSGLIGYVYQSRAYIKAPRTTAELGFWGTALSQEELRSGDLVLFGTATLPNHAGIYVGEGRFVHAPSAGGTVRLERLDARHWLAQRPRFRRP